VKVAYINNHEGYKKIIPGDEHVVGGLEPPVPIKDRNGLYCRADIELDMDQAAEHLVKDPSNANIQEYQYWAEGNWKTEHGTYSSVERFGEKLKEEFFEAVEAIDIYRFGLMGDPELAANVKSELGDVLWCTSALASNGGADIDAGLKNLLFRYVSGTQLIVHNNSMPMPWRDKAARLATKFNQITIGEIDELIWHQFEPQPSPIVNYYEFDAAQWTVDEHLRIMLRGTYIEEMLFITERQYGRKEGLDGYATQSLFTEYAGRLSEAVAGLYNSAVYNGAPERIRTGDLGRIRTYDARLRTAALYPLSYQAI
jgi:NTP pyrophosphatase (non-canonical NTP hydrolase)